jgi:rhamnogalacturonan endolyase
VPATPPSPREVTWQTDGKHYQFWTHNDKHDGSFRIPSVRPGKYTLYAYAEGILGEFSKADITIEPGGKPVDLGQIAWSPVRRGKQLWEIGIANRTATEFTHGDRYFDADSQLQYPRLFPNDVNFVIGKSDISNDWYYEHIPHNEDPNARVVPFSGVRGNGRATPYAITFEMPEASRGRATLRIAFCTAGVPVLDVSVNGKSAGPLDLPRTGDSTITRHNIQGIWFERELAFDAALMKQGTNVLTITVPAGPINSGVIYDYLRLELDESAAAPTASAE